MRPLARVRPNANLRAVEELVRDLNSWRTRAAQAATWTPADWARVLYGRELDAMVQRADTLVETARAYWRSDGADERDAEALDVYVRQARRSVEALVHLRNVARELLSHGGEHALERLLDRAHYTRALRADTIASYTDNVAVLHADVLSGDGRLASPRVDTDRADRTSRTNGTE